MNNEGELVRDKQEEVLGFPLSSRKKQYVSCNLEKRFERENSLSPVKMERDDGYLKEKPKNKRSQELSPISLA